jgi:four helix bundle protein
MSRRIYLIIVSQGFKSLRVWQKGQELAVRIYELTQGGSFSRDRGLTDQMRRSAVSISSNIAEGDERDTDKDAVRFFYIAKGSVAELRSQLDLSHRVGYVSVVSFEALDQEAEAIGKMLGALIKARSPST